MALTKITGQGIDNVTVDSSGNLLVGKTSVGVANVGAELRDGVSDYSVTGVSSSSPAALFGRNTDDGDVIRIRKDNIAVGSIGIVDGDIPFFTAAEGTSGLKFDGDNSRIAPCNGSGAILDNTVDLGSSGGRFDDIFATNGTIQTSDANEKQQIASLTDAEITAAKAISQLFKTYKWNSAVEAKGDAARTHTGVIAQDVQQAMTDSGLDAGDYAFFISTDWYVDADGNEVEADAEGAIAKNRKGIRYPELLAFIGAATEQRLANIETRLAALENA